MLPEPQLKTSPVPLKAMEWKTPCSNFDDRVTFQVLRIQFPGSLNIVTLPVACV